MTSHGQVENATTRSYRNPYTDFNQAQQLWDDQKSSSSSSALSQQASQQSGQQQPLSQHIKFQQWMQEKNGVGLNRVIEFLINIVKQPAPSSFEDFEIYDGLLMLSCMLCCVVLYCIVLCCVVLCWLALSSTFANCNDTFPVIVCSQQDCELSVLLTRPPIYPIPSHSSCRHHSPWTLISNNSH